MNFTIQQMHLYFNEIYCMKYVQNYINSPQLSLFEELKYKYFNTRVRKLVS